jgi:hypothetical protein
MKQRKSSFQLWNISDFCLVLYIHSISFHSENVRCMSTVNFCNIYISQICYTKACYLKDRLWVSVDTNWSKSCFTIPSPMFSELHRSRVSVIFTWLTWHFQPKKRNISGKYIRVWRWKKRRRPVLSFCSEIHLEKPRKTKSTSKTSM